MATGGSDPIDRLCAVCEIVVENISQLGFLVYPDENTADSDAVYQLGFLDEIRQKTDCPLCRLVILSCGGRLALDSAEEYTNDITCELSWDRYRYILGEKAPQIRYLSVQLSGGDLSTFEVFHALVPFADDEKLFFGRRIKERQVDFELLKNWLRWCQEWHGESCDKSICGDEEVKMPPYFKVIDVYKQCIVDVSPHSRYLALSYVWGSVKPLSAIKSNILELQQPGSLVAHSNNIPTTIKDAIELVTRLGERYLWVDSLCIVQDDDPDTKQAMISVMDFVYGNALMTIIAASGDNANAGLPGVSYGSRNRSQPIESIKPGMKLTYARNLADLLQSSIYQSRGWTFQERFLSKRCLFFINGQAIFQCRHIRWREDIYAEEPSVDRTFDSYSMDDAANSSSLKSPLDIYDSCILNYTCRKLSYADDILNAFAGILSFLSIKLESSMAYGLPCSTFDFSLLWEPVQRLERRHKFPSWSWAGWTGAVYMQNGCVDIRSIKALEEWLTEHTWIHWEHCELDHGEHLHPLNSSHSNGSDEKKPLLDLSDCGKNPNTIPPRFLWTDSLESRLPLNEGLQHNSRNYFPAIKPSPKNQGSVLHFWTLSANFRISSKDINSTELGENLCLFGIYDAKGVLSGRIELNDDICGSAIDNRSANCEFIALSDTKSAENDPDANYEDIIANYADDNDDGNAAVIQADALEESDRTVASAPYVAAMSVIDCKPTRNGWDYYNVFLIERGKDNVASRGGLGKIHRLAFRHALPPGTQWKEIYLA